MDAKRKAIPKSIRMTVYQKCNGHCAYCGCNLEYRDMQVDHLIPLNGWSEQGTDTVDNMLPACRSCNHYKSRSTLEGFRKMVAAMPDTLMRDSNTYKNGTGCSGALCGRCGTYPGAFGRAAFLYLCDKFH